ncbi:MAG: nucleoside triphosphate pyrophosphohydrolase [Acidobacteriota bacterium]|nr:nucleoside triphosphate pyrophosphohydrolase [Acidobacteriota bacterium]
MTDSKQPITSATGQTTGQRFEQLINITTKLRSREGCPWDREQTLKSLRPFLLEETYEVLDALDRGDLAELEDELGDLFFQVVFLCQIAAESRAFTVDNAIEKIIKKLVRRHPHVFDPDNGTATETTVSTSSEVRGQWEELKAQERAEKDSRKGLLDGVPTKLPSLLRAFEIGSRVAAVGFDWKTDADVVDKIEDEISELRQAINVDSSEQREEEMGDLLFSIANLSRKLGVEPEAALRCANRKFCNRFGKLEERFRVEGRHLQETTLEQMEAAWQAVKTET